MKDHPSDEFDRIPESSTRQGVHRERLIPAGSNGTGLKITVAVLALLILVGAVLLVPRLGLTADGGAPASVSSLGAPTDPPSSSPEATDGSSASPGADVAPPAPTDSADDEPGGTAATEPGSVPADRAQVVNVLNGTGSPGLATVAAGRLAAAGWTSAVPGNWAGAPLDTSVVFYNGETQRSSAEEVADELGISDVVESPDVSADISVVLGPGFQ